MLGVVLVTASIVLLVVTFFLPQYHSVYRAGDESSEVRYYFDKWTETDIQTLEKSYNDIGANDEMGAVMASVKLLVVLTSFLAWILLILLILRVELWSVLFGWFAMAGCVLGLAWPVSKVPAALGVDGGFFNSESDYWTETIMGPASGWYVLLIACVLISATAFSMMASYFGTEHPKEVTDWPIEDLPKEL